MPAASPATVLVIDDELAIRRFLRAALEAQGYHYIEAATAAEGVRVAQHHRPDIVLLDLGLPDRDGIELIAELHVVSDAPILVLTARDAEASKVTALDEGADDYVTKPFSVPELSARIRTALRHRIQTKGGRPCVHTGPVMIDLLQRQVFREGREVALTPKEWAILESLSVHCGRVVTHSQLLRQVWGRVDDGGHHALGEQLSLRVHIRQLRRKLETDPDRPQLIVTETGVGYRLLADDPHDEDRASPS